MKKLVEALKQYQYAESLDGSYEKQCIAFEVARNMTIDALGGASIKTIPSKHDLERLRDDTQSALEYYDSGASLTFDHLENSIARILGLEIPNPELELRGS